MNITVKYFALIAEIAGTGAEELELEPGATAADAVEIVARKHPRLAKAGFRPLVAVNRRHAQLSDELSAGDEVAIFPPVSGG